MNRWAEGVDASQGLAIEGTGGAAYVMYLRPHSYVDCEAFWLKLYNTSDNVTYYPPAGAAEKWFIRDDGHQHWHPYTFFVPRIHSNKDMIGKQWSWIFVPDTDKSWTEWDYQILNYDVNMPTSGTGIISTGVYEDSYDGLSVTVYFKSQTDGTYFKIWSAATTGGSPITITDESFKNYVSNNQWNYLKFEVTSACYVDAEAYIKARVQSRS
jgi:hypothetical protein